jgi:putative DNA primase/helicase
MSDPIARVAARLDAPGLDVAINDVMASVVEERIVPAPTKPMSVARAFLADRHTDNDGINLIRHYRGDWHVYSGTCWPEDEDRSVRADVWRWLEGALYLKTNANGTEVELAFDPTRNKIANVVEALQALTHLAAAQAAPTWLDSTSRHEDASEMIALNNGLLHLPTRTLAPHTPSFFCHHALPFDFNPFAASPERWLLFLREIWGDDVEMIETLQEIMGYVLGGSTDQQKMFMFVGPKRSGKGTVARVLSGLLGVYNTAAPTLSSLTTNFGLSPLIGKPLATISDARLGSRVDGTIAVERLLSISGEDSSTIDRKYREPWTGRLPTRIIILTNELPRFTDSSGALASRFILLTMTESFYGREDPTLTDALLEESSSILNWALEGLDRLVERGYFRQPEAAAEAMRHLEDLSSPASAFVRDLCHVGAGHQVSKDELFDAWKLWCVAEGIDRPGTKVVFTRNLRAAVPGLRVVKPREGESRVPSYMGIKLAQRSAETRTNPAQPYPVRHSVPDEDGETHRSEGVVRHGPASLPLYLDDEPGQIHMAQPHAAESPTASDREVEIVSDEELPTDPLSIVQIAVSRIGATGSWQYRPLDALGREVWPYKVEWNRHSGLFRTKPEAMKAAEAAFPGVPLVVA